MNSRSYGADKLRTDAIQMAIRRACANLPEDAESYFALAKQHGSTEQDIQQALRRAFQVSKLPVSRRIRMFDAKLVLRS